MTITYDPYVRTVKAHAFCVYTLITAEGLEDDTVFSPQWEDTGAA